MFKEIYKLHRLPRHIIRNSISCLPVCFVDIFTCWLEKCLLSWNWFLYWACKSGSNFNAKIIHQWKAVWLGFSTTSHWIFNKLWKVWEYMICATLSESTSFKKKSKLARRMECVPFFFLNSFCTHGIITSSVKFIDELKYKESAIYIMRKQWCWRTWLLLLRDSRGLWHCEFV